MLLPHVRRTIGDEMNDMTELLQSQASLLSLMMRNLSSLPVSVLLGLSVPAVLLWEWVRLTHAPLITPPCEPRVLSVNGSPEEIEYARRQDSENAKRYQDLREVWYVRQRLVLGYCAVLLPLAALAVDMLLSVCPFIQG